jgi:hypothetical protein
MVRAFFLLTLLATSAHAEIELFTMGPGEEIFSTFGHAAICVRDPRSPQGRCYNYGTADFRTPLPLTWSFIRGRALFWVSVLDTPSMLNYYAMADRAVYRQVLSLSPQQDELLAQLLEASTDERVKYYRYHHFNDNCTTRIRDLVNQASGGRLDQPRNGRRKSFRQWSREGFAGNLPLLMAVELLLGRSADRVTDSWDAMFLPSELRVEVAARLASPPQLLVKSSRPPLSGSPYLGELGFVALGLLLAALAMTRVGLAVDGIFLGLVATILWALFALSSFPELTRNENLLAYWPTDLALGFLPRPWLRRYLDVRLVGLALLVVGHLFIFVQPLATLALPLLPLVAARLHLR